MFIASKLADPCPITGTELVRYTNDTYNLTELLVSDTCMRNTISVGGFTASLGVSRCSQASLDMPGMPRRHLLAATALIETSTWFTLPASQCSGTAGQGIASANDGTTKS